MSNVQFISLPIGDVLAAFLGGYASPAVSQPVAKTVPTAKLKQDKFIPLQSPAYGFSCPPVSRVIFNDDATVVIFADGTKSAVKREANDPYDRTTAVVYALVKRMLATSYNMKNGEVNAAYINAVHELVDTAYDQQKEEAKLAARQKNAQAEHEARQKALQEKAFARRVKNRVRALRVEEAAKAELNGTGCKKPLNEDIMPAAEFFNDTPTQSWQTYKRPNKPFSKFTEKEKKDYWKYHNAKRRASK